MATVIATLDTSGSLPTLVFDPDPLEIDIVGIETVHWKRASDSTFTFRALVFSNPNPFQCVVVKDVEITARDNNAGRDFHLGADANEYEILFEVNKVIYSTKGGGITTGGPTIKNN